MYAVIESGGKQYRVELGSEIQVDRLDVHPGDSITLDRVLLVSDGDDTAIGQPVVDGATVSAEVLGQDRGDKIVVFKYKPKARTRVKKGFRAELTTLRISDIALAGKSAAKVAKSSQTKKAKADKEAQQAAAEKAAADQELAAKLATASEPAATEAPAGEKLAAEPKAKPPAKAKTTAATKSTTKKASVAKKAAAEPAPDAEAPAPEAEAPADTEPGADDATAETKKDG